jgi:hypothetical protein
MLDFIKDEPSKGETRRSSPGRLGYIELVLPLSLGRLALSYANKREYT